jgi:NAD(P)-dependent dehydrogenase (short-subunit alcohol dehydrogenase family)
VAASKHVFITGVSSGIGHSLAEAYLDRGCRVYGVSRRRPADLATRDGFAFESLDLCDHARIAPALESLLAGVDRVHLAVLNAGVLGPFGDLGQIPLADLGQVTDVNLWANKTLLDGLFSESRVIDQVVTLSSGASVNGNRGWAGYAISKAALNMLTRLYAQERPATHFCALAPGVLQTAMMEQLLSHPRDDRYPSLDVLRAKQNTPQLPRPEAVADRLIEAFARLPELVASGDYADVRNLPEPE